MSGRDPYCRPAAVPPAAAPAAVLLVPVPPPAAVLVWATPTLHPLQVIPAIRYFPMVPPAAVLAPPPLRKGRPGCREPGYGPRGQAPRDHQAPDHGNSRGRCTGRAGGTSLYHFAAILPRTGPVRGRSRLEDSIPPPAPLRGEWSQAAFPVSASLGLVRWFHREGCLHGPALIAPPAPLPGGAALAESSVAALLRLPLGGMVHIPGAIGRPRGRRGAALRSAPLPSACRASAPHGPQPQVAPAGRIDRQAARTPRAPPGSAGTPVSAPPVLSGPRAPSSQVFRRPGQTRHAGQVLKIGFSPLPPAGGVWWPRPCIAPPWSLPGVLRSSAPSLRPPVRSHGFASPLPAGKMLLPKMRRRPCPRKSLPGRPPALYPRGLPARAW